MVIFSGRDSGLFDLVLDCSLERVVGDREWLTARDLDRERWIEFGEGGVDDPRVGLGEKDGQSASLAGQLVALGAGGSAG